jgi:hypothetical protein
LVHGVAAFKKHRVGHARAVEVRPGRAPIFAGIDIRFHDGTGLVHKIAKPRRDMIFVLPTHPITPRRSRKPWLAGGDSRFADQLLPFIKVSALFADADYDFGRARNVVALPIIARCERGRRGLEGSGRRLLGGLQLRAAGTKKDREGDEDDSKEARSRHKDADSNASQSAFNPKHLGGRRTIAGPSAGAVSVILAQARES